VRPLVSPKEKAQRRETRTSRSMSYEITTEYTEKFLTTD
jgi:hypothetical protein